MIEIFLLVFLLSKIRKIAEEKGLSKIRWTFRTIFLWLSGEFIFLLFAMSIIGFEVALNEKLWVIVPIGLLGGLLGYWIALYLIGKEQDKTPDLPPAEEKDLSYFR